MNHDGVLAEQRCGGLAGHRWILIAYFWIIMDYTKLITIDPTIRSGKPCIRGMRITVGDVLEYLGGGMSISEILVDFPYLTEEDIRACLAYAGDRERRLHMIPPAA